MTSAKRVIGLLTLAITLLLPMRSFAELLNTEELSELEHIRSNDSYGKTLSQISEKQAKIVGLMSELEAIRNREDRAKQDFETLKGRLGDSLAAGEAETLTDKLYGDLKSASRYLKQERTNKDNAEGELFQLEQDKKSLDASLREQEDNTIRALNQLQQNILARLANEASKPQMLEFSGDYNCSASASLRACIKDPLFKREALRQATKNNLGNDTFEYETKEFNITSATIDLDGRLSYSGRAQVYLRYNDNLASLVADTIGLNKYSVNLVSDVDAVFYVDGREVGQGKRVNINLNHGKHAITATHKQKSSSTVENITTERELVYRFNAPKTK